MIRFLIGLVVGIVVGAGGLALYEKLTENKGEPRASATAPDAGPRDRGKKRGGRRTTPRLPQPGETPIELGADDVKMVAEGGVLRARDVAMDMSEGAPEPRDLEQGEIDAAIGARAGDIVECIQASRGAAPLSGRVTAGFVVTAQGGVGATRVEAPAYLVRHAVGRCVRPILASLRFPATGKETVVTVPFDIE